MSGVRRDRSADHMRAREHIAQVSPSKKAAHQTTRNVVNIVRNKLRTKRQEEIDPEPRG